MVEATSRLPGRRPTDRHLHIASGSRTSLLELLHAVSLAAGRDVEPLLGPPRPGDIQHSQADVSLARQALGFAAQVSLGEGIAGTLEWFALTRRSEEA
jgi:nucleoside-diphosphate-sugar epimerase